MGEKDITEKLLEDYNDVFADIVNVLLFHGKKVVQEEEGEVKNMCEVLDRVENRGIAKGIAKGIGTTIEVAKEYGATRESIIEKLKEKYSLSEEEARKNVDKYYS